MNSQRSTHPPASTKDHAGTTDHSGQTAARGVFGWAKLLVGAYLGLSVLTLVAIFVLRHNASAVNDAVWVRGGIVALTAGLMLIFTVQAGRGSRGGYLRVRIVSAIMLVAIVVIIALPGAFPLWMKIEQGVCGALLFGVVLMVNGKAARSVFKAR